MNYRINLSGVNCDGCKNLVKMMLEENGFVNVEVNEKNATFDVERENLDVKSILDEEFPKLPHHQYSDLIKLN